MVAILRARYSQPCAGIFYRRQADAYVLKIPAALRHFDNGDRLPS
jgi:hypothetical protein